jgi:hypothetical protein
MVVGGSRVPSSVTTVVRQPRRITASWIGVPDPVPPRSTLEEVPESDPPPTPRPPGRALLRAAGALTQLSCGACLLIGTIAIVLVQQTKVGGGLTVSLWLITAMAGLVFGGLIYRGGLVSMLVATMIDVGFGLILIAIEYDTLRTLLRILPASDVGMIGDGLDIAGFTMIGAGVVCLIALPQGIRYARWFRGAAMTRNAMSTARGFPPPPVPARTSAYVIPSEERPESRRRLYMVLGGLAIGVGAGVGVLVSSTRPVASTTASARTGSAVAAPAVPASESVPARLDASAPRRGQPAEPVAATARTDDAPAEPRAGAGAAAAGASRPEAPRVMPSESVDHLLAAQRAAIANADANALARLVSTRAFAFGVDADEVAEGRDAIAAQLTRDLGESPAGSFTVESRVLTIGQERGHAWIAEELEISTPGRERRRLAITELAAAIDGQWLIVALHWATPVDDSTAERLAILKTLPAPHPIADRRDGADDLETAVRAAFASRATFSDAFSERPDAFNLGSGGERARGGFAIKRIFARLRAQIRMHDGARVVAGSFWDPAQTTDPWIGWAAVNVDFTSKTRAATDVTQTFRVLAILIKDGADWKIVQTQWSNGGPIR